MVRGVKKVVEHVFPLNELFIMLCNMYMVRHMSVSDHSLSEGEKAEVLRLLKSHS